MNAGTAPLVDSHVHLDRYSDEEVARMVARAEAAGVRRLLTIGTDLASSQAALALAAHYPSVLAAVGIHPTRLGRTEGGSTAGGASPAPTEPGTSPSVGAGLAPPAPPDADAREPAEGVLRIPPGAKTAKMPKLPAPPLRRAPGGGADPVGQIRALLAQHPAAIGEVGLDEHAPDLSGQAHFLEDCLALAEEHALPLVLHVVGEQAIHEAALALVALYPHVRSVAHYFVGGPSLVERYLDHGCWISVGRPVTRPTEAAVRQSMPLIPPDRLLLETDTYPLPGRSTEPRDVASVCQAVAKLTGRSYEEIAAQTTASFAAFIGQ